MKKKFITSALLIILGLVLSACTPQQKNKEQQPTSLPTSELSKPEPLSGEKPKQEIREETDVDVLTPEECQQKGGRPVNIVGGATCDSNETNIGKVEGFISPNICCLPATEKQEDSSSEICFKKDTNYQLSLLEAKEIAQKSDCVQEGQLTQESFCNENTGTWWLDLQVSDKPGCNPACVINVVTKTAEINWRCTGLIPTN